MLFRRRRPLHLGQKLKHLLWPRGGWRRTATYFLHRLRRLPGTPESIAAGFALGAAISFTPLVGFHIMGALFMAMLIRGNYMAALLGTLVGNPWTFPLMWMMAFKIGAFLLSMEPGEGMPDELSVGYVRDLVGFVVFHRTQGEVVGFPIDWAYIREVVILVMVPWAVGSLVCALLSYPLFYYPTRNLVASYRRRRMALLRRRLERRQQQQRSAEGGAG
jgi:uncharacterized protein (DUF2062 family)